MNKSLWWLPIVLIPGGAVLGCCLAAVITYVMPKAYESHTTIQVMPRGQDPTSLQNPTSFITTEMEVILSANVLEKVTSALELPNRWAQPAAECANIVRRATTIAQIRGTDLLSIRVRLTNREDARDIAQSIAESYRDYRESLTNDQKSRDLEVLNKAVREQEDKVEEQRKVMTFLKRAVVIEAPATEGKAPLAKAPASLVIDKAARTLEAEQSLLEKLKHRQIEETIKARGLIESVQIHQQPVIGEAPVSPNVTLNLCLGLAAGGVSGLILGLLLLPLLCRKPVAPPGPAQTA